MQNSTLEKAKLGALVGSFLVSLGFGWALDWSPIAARQDPSDARFATQKVRWVSVVLLTGLALLFAGSDPAWAVLTVPLLWAVWANRFVVQAGTSLGFAARVEATPYLAVPAALGFIAIGFTALNALAPFAPFPAIAAVSALLAVAGATALGIRAGLALAKAHRASRITDAAFMEAVSAVLGLAEGTAAAAIREGALFAQPDGFGNIEVTVPLAGRKALRDLAGLREEIAYSLSEWELDAITSPSAFRLSPVAAAEIDRRVARRDTHGLHDEDLDAAPAVSEQVLTVDYSALDD